MLDPYYDEKTKHASGYTQGVTIDYMCRVLLYRMKLYNVTECLGRYDDIDSVLIRSLQFEQKDILNSLIFGGIDTFYNYLHELNTCVDDVQSSDRYLQIDENMSRNMIANCSWSKWSSASIYGDNTLYDYNLELNEIAKSLVWYNYSGYKLDESRHYRIHSDVLMFEIFSVLSIGNDYLQMSNPCMVKSLSPYRFIDFSIDGYFDPILKLFPHITYSSIDISKYYSFIDVFKDDIVPEISFLGMLLNKSYDQCFYDVIFNYYTKISKTNIIIPVDAFTEYLLDFILVSHYYKRPNGQKLYHTIPLFEFIVGSKCFSSFNDWLNDKLVNDANWVNHMNSKVSNNLGVMFDISKFILPTNILMDDPVIRKIYDQPGLDDFIIDQDSEYTTILDHIDYNLRAIY